MPPLQQEHLDAILVLRVRDHLALDLAPAPQLDDVRPGTAHRRTHPSRGDRGADRPAPRARSRSAVVARRT